MDTFGLFRPWPTIRFHYGTMEAGKSLKLLVACHQLRSQNVNLLVMTALPYPKTKQTEYQYQISSRCGIAPIEATGICTDDSIAEIVNHFCSPKRTHLMIDEAQFLTAKHVSELRAFVEADPSHRVDCFGLRTDFTGKFFEGSSELMRCADQLVEIPNMCSICKSRPATHNMRLTETGEKADVNADQIALKDNTRYISVCYNCWNQTSTNDAIKTMSQ